MQGVAKSPTCEGETIVVNLQGALIVTGIELCIGMRIWFHVYLTDKRATARHAASVLVFRIVFWPS